MLIECTSEQIVEKMNSMALECTGHTAAELLLELDSLPYRCHSAWYRTALGPELCMMRFLVEDNERASIAVCAGMRALS